jgi:hypothetical protein
LLNKRMLSSAAIAYFIALITSWFTPEIISLLIPFVGVYIGYLRSGKDRVVNMSDELATAATATVMETAASSEATHSRSEPRPEPRPEPKPQPDLFRPQIDPEFVPLMEYLDVLEDMVISEGQKNNLDDEIVERSLALFARLQRVIPRLQELNNENINHTIRRLVLKDLNGFIRPFLRLSPETRTKNRQTLLNGLSDINVKITSIVETVEHKDLMELQTKADLIHSRYNDSDF